MKAIIILSICLIALAFADPQPTGGAACTRNSDCGGANGGYCEPNANYVPPELTRSVEQVTSGTCVCNKERGNPDCSYERHSRSLTGGLQFLCFVGVAGVGDLILGRNLFGGLQMAFLFSVYLLGIAACLSCCVGSIKQKLGLGLFGTLTCLLGTLSFIGWLWSIIDGALILQGQVTDANGYATFQ